MTSRPSIFLNRIWFAVVSGLPFCEAWLYGQAAAPQTDEIPPLRPPRGEIPPGWWEAHGGHVVILSAVAILLVGLLVWFIRRTRPKSAQPPELVAAKTLTRLKNEPENGDVLSQVSRALRQYLGAAFALPPEELTTREFCAVLQEKSPAGRPLADEVSQFLQECDRRKFAGMNDATPMGAATRALGLVEVAEKRRAELRQEQAAAVAGSKAS